MKSSQLFSFFLLPLIFAGVEYAVLTQVSANNSLIAAAIMTFIACLATAFVCHKNTNDDNHVSTEVKTLYVGNLPYRANESAVRELFAQYGVVHSVRLMKDKNTGKRRGFGFVEMNANHADKAVSALNDTEFQQRTLKIREAKERTPRSDNTAE